MPPDQQGRDLGGDRLLGHRRVAACPGLVAQREQVVPDVGEQLRAADVAVPGHHHPRVLRGQPLQHGDPAIALAGMPPSDLVVAWNEADANPLIRSFAQIAAARYR
jgi:hypothetical protein